MAWTLPLRSPLPSHWKSDRSMSCRLRKFLRQGSRRTGPKRKSTQKSAVNEMSGMTEPATAPIVYIDANPFIYAVEGDDALARPLKDFFELLRQRPRVAVTSELTLAEVLPKAHLPQFRRSYFHLIVWSGIFDLRPVTREILIETADYRQITATLLPGGGRTMIKLPDAIHAVTAIRSGCTKMLSADAQLKLPVGVAVVEPDETGLLQLMREIS